VKSWTRNSYERFYCSPGGEAVRMETVLKVHYYLWFSSLVGILPYVTVFGKEYIVDSATQIGLLYSILPFVSLVVKPLGCALADRLNAHRRVLLCCMSTTLASNSLLLMILFMCPPQTCPDLTFPLYCGLVLLANSAMGVSMSVTDSLAIREVTRNPGSTFASIGLWGTLGWGILAAGVINDKSFAAVPYLIPGLIMFMIVIIMDIIVVWFEREKDQEPEGDLGGDPVAGQQP